MEPQRKALVLGATGGVGGMVAAALIRHGWSVRGLARDVEAARKNADAPIEWVAGDAMDRAAVIAAAEGTSAIVHAVNPPGYRNWERLVLPMIDNTIAAARHHGGLRIVLPGTIYNYDAATAPVITADTPQRATSRKGAVRVEMEARLRAASGEAPCLIVRAGDFFGPGARSSWFSQAMVRPGHPIRRITNPAHGGGHSWAYLPDLAETFARLMDASDRLLPIECVPFEGYFDATGRGMIDALRKAAGRKLTVLPFPWWLMRALAPFGGFAREAVEIAPHWRHPARFDNARLVELLGAEPRTPLDIAVRDSLLAMGCLPPQRAGLLAAAA